MIRAVLDTNALLSARYRSSSPSGQILQLARENAFELVLSRYILNELARTLLYPDVQKMFGKQIERVRRRYVGALFVRFPVIEPAEGKWVPDDANDDPIVGTAVAAHADYLVTRDKHMLQLKQVHGTQIVRAHVFLDILQDATSQQ